MTRFAAPIAEQIWDMKYRLKGPDGAALDLTVQDSWRRVAHDLARVEADPAVWQDRFYHALQDFRFLPAGRILAGAGTGREVTLFNCFVMGTIPDSIPGRISGAVTVKNTLSGDAPRLAAATSSLGSKTERLALTAIITKGRASSVWARMKPSHVPTKPVCR